MRYKTGQLYLLPTAFRGEIERAALDERHVLQRLGGSEDGCFTLTAAGARTSGVVTPGARSFDEGSGTDQAFIWVTNLLVR